MFSYPEEVITLLEENEKFNELSYMEKNDFIESINNEEIKCLELIEKYKIYEILLQCESNSEITNYLKNNILKIFEENNKYNFDLAISYIYSNKETITQEQKNVIGNSPEYLSFVTKELIYETDQMEIKSLKSERSISRIFNIKEIEKEVEEMNTQKTKTKK